MGLWKQTAEIVEYKNYKMVSFPALFVALFSKSNTIVH